MNLRQLELFVAVVDRGSITRTAEALQISQPAVSARIHALEQRLGQKLFEQVGRQLMLTEAGRELRIHAERILRSVSDAERAVAELRGLERGTLRVVATTTIGTYILPQLLATFQRAHPALQLVIDVMNEEQAIEAIRQEQMDLALVGLDRVAGDLVAEPLLSNELCAVAAPSHPLAAHTAISFELFAHYPILLREVGSGMRSVAEKLFSDHGFRPPIAIELRQNAVIKQAVIAGLGTGVLSSHGCEAELACGALVRLTVEGLPVRRDWHIVSRREGQLPPAAAAFRQQLREFASARAISTATLEACRGSSLL